jgi:hypothetical protein
MMYATTPAKSAKRTTITTDAASVVISGLRLPRARSRARLGALFHFYGALFAMSRELRLVSASKCGWRGAARFWQMTAAIEAGPGMWLKLAAVAAFIVLAAWAANRQRK